MEDREGDSLGRTLGRLYLILCIAYMAWLMWALMVPDHRKQALKLRLLRSSGQVMSRLARRAGAASVAREATTGLQQYSIPYRLSLARGHLERAYDRARGVTL